MKYSDTMFYPEEETETAVLISSGTILATQGGGYATQNKHGENVFIEVPNWGNFVIGEKVPEEWDLIDITRSAETDLFNRLLPIAKKLF